MAAVDHGLFVSVVAVSMPTDSASLGRRCRRIPAIRHLSGVPRCGAGDRGPVTGREVPCCDVSRGRHYHRRPRSRRQGAARPGEGDGGRDVAGASGEREQPDLLAGGDVEDRGGAVGIDLDEAGVLMTGPAVASPSPANDRMGCRPFALRTSNVPLSRMAGIEVAGLTRWRVPFLSRISAVDSVKGSGRLPIRRPRFVRAVVLRCDWTGESSGPMSLV